MRILESDPMFTVYDGDDFEADLPEEPETEAPAPEPKQPEKQPNRKKVELPPHIQALVNSQIAEERRKAKAKNDELIIQLESVRNRADTTQAERTALEDRIETLRAEFATKEELTAQANKKTFKELEQQRAALEAERNTWKQRFERNKKKVDLTGAAVAGGAFRPEQLVKLLDENTRLVEVVDDSGKPTGEYETRVKLSGRDKEDKPTVFDLSPAEAIKLMREMDDYANQFISPATGGLGGNSLANRGGRKGLHELSTSEYMAERRKRRGNTSI